MKQNQTHQDKPRILLPNQFSPTSLEQFKKCPQAFFFLYILKLTPDPPITPQLARGSIIHTALEELFDLSPENRSLSNLENLFRKEWCRLRGDRGDCALAPAVDGKSKNRDYDVLFRGEGNDSTTSRYDIDAEIEWGKSSLDLLRNYCDLERPQAINPLMTEMWVNARFSSEKSKNAKEEFVVKGKIDRIDVLSSHPDEIQLQIIDYKTGKKPNFKYSRSTNERIAQDEFWKMKVYALMLRKMIHRADEQERETTFNRREGGTRKDQHKYGMPWVLHERLLRALPCGRIDRSWADVLRLDSLRLMYLNSHLDDPSANDPAMAADRSIGKAKCMDCRIGSPSEFQSILDETEIEVQMLVSSIKKLVDAQSPLAFEHCDWRYCSCHELRRKFRPGSVFRSPDLDLDDLDF